MRRFLRQFSLFAVGALAVGALAVAGPSLAAKPAITVKPTHLNLGRVTVGQTSSKLVTITNNSTDTTYYGNSRGPSSGSDYFGWGNADGWYDFYYYGIAAGQSATLEIVFSPEEAGRFGATAYVRIGTAAQGEGNPAFEFTFSMSGVGLVAAP